MFDQAYQGSGVDGHWCSVCDGTIPDDEWEWACTDEDADEDEDFRCHPDCCATCNRGNDKGGSKCK